jgi:hypothetical protein
LRSALNDSLYGLRLGFVSAFELSRGVDSATGGRLSTAIVHAIMEMADTDRDGKISPAELMQLGALLQASHGRVCHYVPTSIVTCSITAITVPIKTDISLRFRDYVQGNEHLKQDLGLLPAGGASEWTEALDTSSGWPYYVNRCCGAAPTQGCSTCRVLCRVTGCRGAWAHVTIVY